MFHAIKNSVRDVFSSKEKMFDAAIDLALDVTLIIVDVLSAPIVLPARIAARALKGLIKMTATRETRKAVKVQIKQRVTSPQVNLGEAQDNPNNSPTSSKSGSEA